jgi:hypothetical protein
LSCKSTKKILFLNEQRHWMCGGTLLGFYEGKAFMEKGSMLEKALTFFIYAI